MGEWSAVERLRGRLVVSCQAPPGSPLDQPDVIAAIAAAAVRAGAGGVRINRPENVRAVRAAVTVPIIGIWKQPRAGEAVYITPSLEAASAVAEAGADIIALDATPRRAGGYAVVTALVGAVRARLGLPVMADVASLEDGVCSASAGAELIATTLCGYTDETRGAALPMISLLGDLVRAMGDRARVVCEGGVQSPQQVAAAFAAGAFAVVVGTALTGIEARVRMFASAATLR